MGNLSTLSTFCQNCYNFSMASRRNYVTAAEVNTMAGFTPTDNELNIAEELIDTFVGFQNKYMAGEIHGRASGGGVNTINLETSQQNSNEADYFKYCEVEIIAGTGAGQRGIVSSSTKAGVLTMVENWTTAPDATSIYRIYQLGKFPRDIDGFLYTNAEPYVYAKSIPEMVKRAVAAQVEYMHTMGSDFFATDKADKVSESIGDYAYSNALNGVGVTGVSKFIAPKAKLLLKGIQNRCGEIT